MATSYDESSLPVAIVTGAGRGIGRATAVELSDRGYRIVLVSRTRSDLEATAEACAGETLIAVADLEEATTLELVISAAVEGFGRLDALVNNAGLARSVPFDETDDATLRATIEVNLISAFTLARLAWPHLKATRGTIVNISSLSADDPFPGLSAYAAAKAGVHGLTIALANEGSPHGIRCVCIAPSGTETGMFRALPGMADIPGDQLLEPADVAGAIAEAIAGPLAFASGEVIRLRRQR